MGYALTNMGNYPRSLKIFLSALAIAEDPKSEQNIVPGRYPDRGEFLKRPVTAYMLRLDILAKIHHYLGILYGNTNNYRKQLQHDLLSRQLAEQTGNDHELCINYLTLGRVYLSLHNLDSALICAQKANDLSVQTGYKKYLGSILLNLGRIRLAQGNRRLATDYYKKALAASHEQNYLRGVTACNLSLSDLYRESGKKDSALYFANVARGVAHHLNSPDLLVRSYTALTAIYRSDNNDSTVKYQELTIRMNESLFNSKQAQQFQNIDYDAQQHAQEIQEAEKDFQNRLQKYGLLAGLAGFLLLVIFLWRNNRHREKSNAILQGQKKEIEIALSDLKATQSQLIQSEKMASLGELTAGIAHEIQNPLNFVNNFSDVNTELIDEMQQELKAGNSAEAINISNHVKENLEKINHHGKRADAIVKGMLQHSRTSTGVKEPTDINALADEYLRLSYHGLRAKDKSFNATLKTDFDESLSAKEAGAGKVNVIPQDLGRVILNLFTNAFYSVAEKKRLGAESQSVDQMGHIGSAPAGYEPTVSVSTKRLGNKVEIKIRDNGLGIPQKVMDKIFQPFFSTKPTGQGTGLGLSISYDIITKAHGGQMNVETKEGEFAEFIITLPV